MKSNSLKTAFLVFLLLSLFLLPLSAVSCAENPYFSQSDYNDVAREAEDAVITLEGDHGTLSDPTRGQSGNPVIIERKGVYRITGQADGVTIRIEEPRKSGNIYLILDHVTMTNDAGPCIETQAAEKTILQCVGDNSLTSTSEDGATVFSEDALTINGSGRLVIEAGKNGIHCKDALRVTGAALTVRAGNDGLKGKHGIYIGGGSITVENSYEAMEGGEVLICDGELRLFASDDGINAAGEDELQGDVIIYGGNVYLNASGDAIDSNRSILIEGGTTLVEGPENSRNSIFDKGDGDDAILSISGGTVIAIGSAEKAKSFKGGSQYSRLEPVSGHAGDLISADDGSGIILKATKDFGCVIYSSPSFTPDSRIQVTSASAGEGGVRFSDDSSDFVLLSDAVPDAVLEIRYYSTYNFVGERIEGYEEPLAFLTREAAAALREVSDELVSRGYRLKIYDAYRPQKAVNQFVNWTQDAEDLRMKAFFYPELEKDVLFPQGYLSEHSDNTRGSSVDLTLFDMKTEKEIDMGGTFDFFGTLSRPDCPDITEEQYANRQLLCEVMKAHGFRQSVEKWWHFTLEDEPYPDTYFTFPVSSDSLNAA